MASHWRMDVDAAKFNISYSMENPQLRVRAAIMGGRYKEGRDLRTRSRSTRSISPNIRGRMEKSQDRMLSRGRVGGIFGLSTVLLSRISNPPLMSR
jgi:hypothetical protein